MPKAGRYDYPSRDLDDCIESLRKAFEKTQSHVVKRDIFAEAIEMSSKGGAFNLLVGSMAIYDLIETGSGDIRYTDLAQKILHGEPEEIAEARNTAVRKVQLFADIFDKYGPAVTQDQLRLFLRETAVVDISEASNLAIAVGKLFKSCVQYLRPLKPGQKPPLGGDRKPLSDEISIDGDRKSVV